MNLKNRFAAIATIAAIAIPTVALAGYKMMPNGEFVPKASFNAWIKGAKIEGKTGDVSLKDDGGNVIVTVDLKRVNTDMDLRNEHFQTKFLGKNKQAVLSVAKDALKGKEKGGDVPAKLTLNGTTKDVKLNFKSSPVAGDRLKVVGSVRAESTPAANCTDGNDDTRCSLKYTDFGWKPMCFAGVCVDENIEISSTIFISAKD